VTQARATGELVLAIDQGTTGSTVLVVNADGRVLGRGYREHPQSFPAPGLVEHDPQAIWESVVQSASDAFDSAECTAADIGAVGITNQRETLVAWDAATSQPLGPAIVWQDRRTTDECARLIADGHAGRIRELTGLPVDPYFTGTKLAWLVRNRDDVRTAASVGTLRVGTIDTWLIWKLSGGACHVTDASNASRTLLYDIHSGGWARELLDLFDVDPAWLPTVGDSCGDLAHTDPAAAFGVNAPVAGIAGDQQSALFGQQCLEVGQAKATYGTGAFVLVNCGDSAPVTDRLLSTIAWQRDGDVTYALEGAVFTAGASVQWLRDGLRVIDNAAQASELAAAIDDPGGVIAVPAFAGLGAPHWDPSARAALLGMTRGTTTAHVSRALLEGIVFRVRDVLDAMHDEGTRVRELRVDGGMAASDIVLQLQADIAGIPVIRPANLESTSTGAALLAALGCGMTNPKLAATTWWKAGRTFEPSTDAVALHERYEAFSAAIELVRTFATPKRVQLL
jgi:glycerol kinase